MQAPISLKNKMLSTPLLPKTSTPIRARVLATDPLNSTPINQLKICITPNSNKQNTDSSNFSHPLHSNQRNQNPPSSVLNIKNLTSNNTTNSTPLSFADFRFHKKSPQTIKNTNEPHFQSRPSPTLSLSKKSPHLQQSTSFTKQSGCFSNNHFRSLTPNIFTKKEPFISSKDKFHAQSNKDLSSTLNQSSSHNNLRNSNTFSTIFQARSKTPTRLGSMAFGTISRKENSSSSSQNLNIFSKSTTNHRKQNQPISSPTNFQANFQPGHDSFSNSFMNSFAEQGTLMCIKNHGKKAKYRIKPSEQQNIISDSNSVYCSKCAIGMVQLGFAVEELQQLPEMISHTSLRELRQSSSFRQSHNFMSFKSNSNSEIMEKIRTAQKLKLEIQNQKLQLSNSIELFQNKFHQQIQSIDCFYDSIIAYIEQQRVNDKQSLQTFKNKVLQAVNIKTNVDSFEKYHMALGMILERKIFDNNAMNIINQIQLNIKTLQKQPKLSGNKFTQCFYNPQAKLVTMTSTIQDQFDTFVSYFDNQGKLSFKTFEKTFEDPRIIPKNNPLRFSFEKALQNQNKKKSFICDSDAMNPLQEEDEDNYDENSFSHDFMKQTGESGENGEQKVFRTLFEEESILDQDEQDSVKVQMHSPTFKSI